MATLAAMRLLVVDDDSEMCDLLVRALEADGHLVMAARSKQTAQATLDDQPVDVIVLDLALPDGEGLELCRDLRGQGSTVPVLMLTAHSEVRTRVRSFETGVDDFLGKPFAVAELRARVRALGRRGAAGIAPTTLTLGDITVQLAARRATRGGRPVRLTPREWAVIERLALRSGRIVSRTALLEEIWGESSESAAASLEVIVARIRRKLGGGLIRTVRGEGYALEEPLWPSAR